MLQGVKNIIFDLGGVIYDIDYHRTIMAFKALGIEGFGEVYAKAGQSDLFDDLETGTIQRDEFYKGIQGFLGQHITPQKIDEAWSEMIGKLIPGAISFLKEIAESKNIYLLSNSNPIHLAKFKENWNQYAKISFFAG